MVKKELIRRSPLRILEKAIHGGLKDGNIGVLASRKGIFKEIAKKRQLESALDLHDEIC